MLTATTALTILVEEDDLHFNSRAVEGEPLPPLPLSPQSVIVLMNRIHQELTQTSRRVIPT